MKKNNGRPTIFSIKLGDKICQRLSEGETLRKICKDKKMPSQSTVYYWLLDEDKKKFLELYIRARESQGEVFFDLIDELSAQSVKDIRGDDKSDSARVNARKLQVDTLKWRLARMSPHKYGEKLDVVSDGKPLQGNTIILKDFKSTDEANS